MAAERFVLDASVAIDWFLPGSASNRRYAERILEQISAENLVPVVPDLWHYELGSVLIAAKRDKRRFPSPSVGCAPLATLFPEGEE